MRQLLRFGFALSSLIPVLALAQSPFDGTWRVVPGSDQFPTKPDVYLLQGGAYQCPTCDPPLSIEADGKDHKITGPCYDTVSVKVVDSRTTEETDKRDGRVVGTSKMAVSSDGSTATVESTEMCNAKGDVITVKKSMERVARGPEGAHAVSGSWRTTKFLNMSENALVATMKGGRRLFLRRRDRAEVHRQLGRDRNTHQRGPWQYHGLGKADRREHSSGD